MATTAAPQKQRNKADLKADYDRLAAGDAPANPNKTQEDERGLYVFARFSKQNTHYLGLYQQWTKTIQFILGQQWLTWDNNTRRWSGAAPAPAWRQRLVTNYVYTMMRSVMAKMLKQKPALECVPPSGDSDDRTAARLGASLLRYLWRQLKTSEKHQRAVGWYLATGLVFLHVYWDKDAGTVKPLQQLVEVPNPEYDPEDLDSEETYDQFCPCDEHGAPLSVTDEVTGVVTYLFDEAPAEMPEGEVGLEVVDPMSIRINPDARTYEEATEMMRARLMPKGKAGKMFGIDVGELSKAKADDERQFYDEILSATAASPDLSANQNRVGTGVSDRDAIGEQVMVIEYYAKPSKGFWKGRHWITIGPDKVWPKADDPQYPKGEAPLPHGFWPPFIPVVGNPIPGQPQGQSALGQIVPLNEQLNALNSRIREHEIKMALGGKYIVAESDRNMEDINNDPSQKLVSKGYEQGKPPHQMDVKPLPPAVYARLAEVRDDIRLVGSMSELAVGQTPEGVTSGRAFLVQEEVTDSVWGPDLQAFERGFEEVGRRELIVCQQNYTEARTIRIRGDRGQWEFRAFSGADLVDGLDVEVQAGSSAPFSKTAQFDANISIVQALPGLVTDPATGKVDTAALAKILSPGAGAFSTFQSDEDPTTVQCNREIAMFAAFDPTKQSPDGEPQKLPQISFYTDFPKALQIHYDFLRRDMGEFEGWSDPAQAAYLGYLQQMHEVMSQTADMALDAGDQGGGQMGGGMGNEDPNAAPEMAEDGDAQPADDMESPELTSSEMVGAM